MRKYYSFLKINEFNYYYLYQKMFEFYCYFSLFHKINYIYLKIIFIFIIILIKLKKLYIFTYLNCNLKNIGTKYMIISYIKKKKKNLSIFCRT